jgi:PAS domain S-box-containing protein
MEIAQKIGSGIGIRIGQRIKTARKHAGLTQKQLAEYLGKSGAAVAYLEQGKRRANAEVLMQVSEATAKPLAYFYEDDVSKKADFSQRMDLLQKEVLEIQNLLKSEQDLRKSAEDDVYLFRELFDQSNDHLMVWDGDTGKAVVCNQRVLDDMACVREEFLERTIMEVETGIPTLEVWQKIVQDLKTNGATIMKTEPKRIDGSTFFVEVSAKYVLLEDTVYIVTAARNISERDFHSAEGEDQYLQQYRKLLDHLSFPVLICDSGGKVMKTNPSFKEVFSVLDDSFSLKDIVALACEDITDKVKNCGLNGEVCEREVEFKIADKKYVFKVRMQPFMERSYITKIVILFQPIV